MHLCSCARLNACVVSVFVRLKGIVNMHINDHVNLNVNAHVYVDAAVGVEEDVGVDINAHANEDDM